MPSHFTYAEFEPGSDLEQGDILQPTVALREVLGEVHRHFLDTKYIGFLVTSQTCDLVRGRGDPCSSRYINLAVVRRLASVLPRLLNRECVQVAPNVFTSESKQKAHDLLARVFNQNERSLGLFYLHPDADVGIGDRAVAQLQVSIALRAKEHYDSVVGARSGRLAPQFQSKLGWMVGYLYSRVATEDVNESLLSSWASDVLRGSEEGEEQVAWVPAASARLAESKGVPFAGKTPAEVKNLLKGCKPETRKQKALRIVERVLSEVLPDVPPKDLKRAMTRLNNDTHLTQALK